MYVPNSNYSLNHTIHKCLNVLMSLTHGWYWRSGETFSRELDQVFPSSVLYLKTSLTLPGCQPNSNPLLTQTLVITYVTPGKTTIITQVSLVSNVLCIFQYDSVGRICDENDVRWISPYIPVSFIGEHYLWKYQLRLVSIWLKWCSCDVKFSLTQSQVNCLLLNVFVMGAAVGTGYVHLFANTWYHYSILW